MRTLVAGALTAALALTAGTARASVAGTGPLAYVRVVNGNAAPTAINVNTTTIGPVPFASATPYHAVPAGTLHITTRGSTLHARPMPATLGPGQHFTLAVTDDGTVAGVTDTFPVLPADAAALRVLDLSSDEPGLAFTVDGHAASPTLNTGGATPYSIVTSGTHRLDTIRPVTRDEGPAVAVHFDDGIVATVAVVGGAEVPVRAVTFADAKQPPDTPLARRTQINTGWDPPPADHLAGVTRTQQQLDPYVGGIGILCVAGSILVSPRRRRAYAIVIALTIVAVGCTPSAPGRHRSVSKGVDVHTDEPIETPTIAAVAGWQPTALTIDRLGVRAPVHPRPLADAGQLWKTLGPSDVAWLRTGDTVSSPGRVLLAGHVSYRNKPAVFSSLPSLSIGDVFGISAADGTVRRYVVESVETSPKGDLPSDTLAAVTPGDDQAVLITCGGSIRPDGLHSANVTVVGALLG